MSGEKARIRLEVSVETPLHVWSGNTLIGGFDYVVRGDKVTIVDSECVTSRIAEALEESIDVSEDTVSQSIIKLVDSGKCVARVLPLVFRATPPLCRSAEAVLKRIKEMVKLRVGSDLVPAVPGSEIKGLIRTAILYRAIAASQVLATIISRRLTQELQQLQTARLHVVRKSIKNIGRNLVENDMFFIGLRDLGLEARGENERMDVLSVLMVSDPLNVRDLSSSVRSLLAVDTNSVIGAELVEALDGGSLEFEVVIDIDRIELILKSLRSSQRHIETLLSNLASRPREFIEECLREFSKKSIELERQRVDRVMRSWRQRGLDRRFRSVYDSLSRYRQYLEEAERNLGREIRARIGFGTNRRWKTVVHAFNDPGLERTLVSTMSRYVALSSRRRIRHWDDSSLRLVEVEGSAPFVGSGWIRISLR